jgi:acyl-CoA hydrolase
VLDNPLETQYGGTGLDSFTEKGVLFASSTSVLSFVTGSSGKILQINNSGDPVFDDLNGGDYS